jgi:hypothetical protein
LKTRKLETARSKKAGAAATGGERSETRVNPIAASAVEVILLTLLLTP